MAVLWLERCYTGSTTQGLQLYHWSIYSNGQMRATPYQENAATEESGIELKTV